MSGRNARAILFNDGADEQNDVLGLDAVLSEAEAAYDAAEAAGDVEGDGEVEIDLSDAAEGDEGGEDADAEATDESVDGGGDGAGGGEGEGADAPDGSADEVAGDDGNAQGASEGEPAPLRYANQHEAERAQQEARDAMNRAMWERDQALAQARAAQEYQQSIAAQAPPAPTAPDTQAILATAQTNPLAGFQQAIKAGDDDAVGQIMATVLVDSNAFAAKAAMAADEGDAESAQVWQQRAINAANLHRQMQHEDMAAKQRAQEQTVEAKVQEALAPIQTERMTQELSQAAHKVLSSEFFEGVDTAQYDAQIGHYIQTYPHIMGDWSREAMEEGWLVAAQQVIFGSRKAMVDHLVQRRVEEATAAQHPAAKSKSRGTAGGAGRKPSPAPAPGSAQAQADAIRAEVGTGSRPSGMGLFFGG